MNRPFAVKVPSVPLCCLVWLWDSRADTLDKCEAVVVNNKLFKELGYAGLDGRRERKV
jgi:hypothetical protein